MSISELVLKLHEKNGGLPADGDLEKVIEGSLRSLSYGGKANRISKGCWRIPRYDYQRIFGEGKHWVYLYYFNDDKLSAEAEGDEAWPCKIGEAEKNPEKRVKNQTSGARVEPRIALLLRTNQHKALEKVIHGILTLMDRPLKDTQGREWFLTNPDEVAEIWEKIDDLVFDLKTKREDMLAANLEE